MGYFMFKRLKLMEQQMQESRVRVARSMQQIRSESPALNQMVSLVNDIQTQVSVQYEAQKIKMTILSYVLATGVIIGIVIGMIF
jgi:S-adenosylmethionine synthetase